MQTDIVQRFYNALSSKRVQKYSDHLCLEDDVEVLCAHKWNIELSKNFYPSLRILEVVLRNALHSAISQAYCNEYWFEDHRIIKANDIFSTRLIEKIRQDLQKHNKAFEPDRVVAELHFGFWTSLFDRRFEHQQVLWPKLLKLVFPNIPRQLRTRSELSKRLNRIRLLRNRIFHHEPIWYWNNLMSHHKDILDMISWIEPIMSDYVLLNDNLSNIYEPGWLQYKTILKY